MRAAASPSTTKGRGTMFISSRSVWRRDWSPTASIWSSCAMAATASRRCGSPTDGTAVRNNQWSAPLYWEQRDGEWWNYTIEGHAAAATGRAGVPHQLLRGRRVCPLGGRAAAQRIRVGNCGALLSALKGILSSRASCIRSRHRSVAAAWRRCSAMYGSGRRAPTFRIPVSSPLPARSANTTASSCATR